MFKISIFSLLIIPIIGSFLIYFFRKNINNREAMSFLTAIPLFGIVLNLFLQEKVTSEVVTILNFFPGVSLSFFYDHLSIVFAFVASFLWIITTMYSIGYMRGANEKNQTRFFICFAIAISATMGVAFSANLFTLFIFYELLSISTYALVGHHQGEEARIGARKYVIFLFGGSIGLALPAMILVYLITGTFGF